MSDSILAELFASLDTIVLESLDGSLFRILTNIPGWFSRLYSIEQDEPLSEESLPFLVDFLSLAEEFWSNANQGQLKSDYWTETDSANNEYRLEATALCLGDKRLLLIQELGAEFEQKRNLLQRARESNIAFEYVTKDLEKKQMLLSSIVYDLKEPLTGIRSFFAALDVGKLTAREKQFLEIGKRQTQRIEKLIQELIDASAPNQNEKT